MPGIMEAVRSAIIRRAYGRDDFIDRHLAHFIGGITIMPNNICNADCVFCAYRFNEEPKDTMSLELFKRTIDETFTLGYLGTLVLTPVAGEPLADPTLFEKIAYAKSKGVQNVTFTTNAILMLKNDNWRKCIDAGLHTLHISSSGLSDEAYKRMYRSKRYPVIIEGIQKLLAYKEEKNDPVLIKLLLRLDRPLEEAMQDEGMAAVRPYLERGTLQLDDIRNNFDNWSGHISEGDLIGNMTLNDAKERPVPCQRMTHDLAVLPDGKVRVCSCRYFRTNHDELVIGDLNEKPMKEIHFGDTHRQLLKDVAQGKWPRVCDKCSLYEPSGLTTMPLLDLVKSSIKS